MSRLRRGVAFGSFTGALRDGLSGAHGGLSVRRARVQRLHTQAADERPPRPGLRRARCPALRSRGRAGRRDPALEGRGGQRAERLRAALGSLGADPGHGVRRGRWLRARRPPRGIPERRRSAPGAGVDDHCLGEPRGGHADRRRTLRRRPRRRRQRQRGRFYRQRWALCRRWRSARRSGSELDAAEHVAQRQPDLGVSAACCPRRHAGTLSHGGR
mmetsp:Transcript_140365/g.448643  ORF Transcript_140365/g.448643 Transcript_140365/m.448643 type:complete len:215 (+) Transcript_140365:1726-2370(+)